MAPPYIYKGFTRKDEFRVLNLRPGGVDDPIFFTIMHEILPACPCVIQHIIPRPPTCPKCQELAEIPQFEALSYTWGDTTILKTVYCEAPDKRGITHSMQVTVNCDLALRSLRDPIHWRKLWIDAICIEQSNTEERNAQVRIMQRMYRAASRVVVYLGVASPSSDRAITVLENETKGLTPLITDDISKTDVQSILDLLSRPWFHRVWVLQEIAYAWTAIVVCGERTTDWTTTFHKNLESWLGYHERLRPFPHVMSFGPSWLQKNEFTPLKFFDELCRTRACQATEVHDKIYAVLSLFRDVPPHKELIVDYARSPEELFIAVARFLLRTVGLEVLSWVSAADDASALPSWVPDWTGGRPNKSTSSQTSDTSQRLKITPSQASQASQVASSQLADPILEVHAIFVDVVHVVGNPCSKPIKRRWETEIRQWQNIIEKELFDHRVTEGASSAVEAARRVVIASEFFDMLNPHTLNQIYRGKDIYPRLWNGLKSWCEGTLNRDGLPHVDWLKFAAQSAEHCQNSRLVLLRDHRVPGLAPLHVREGDEIYVFRGTPPRSRTLAVLRQKNTGYHVFVGMCNLANTRWHGRQDWVINSIEVEKTVGSSVARQSTVVGKEDTKHSDVLKRRTSQASPQIQPGDGETQETVPAEGLADKAGQLPHLLDLQKATKKLGATTVEGQVERESFPDLNEETTWPYTIDEYEHTDEWKTISIK